MNYDAASSSPISVSVGQVTPSITVVGTPLTNVFGAPITFTATVTGVVGSVAPTGAITWNLGGQATTCSSNTGPLVTGVSSVYTCVVPVNNAGTYTASVSLGADSNYLAVAQSGTFSINVGPELTTIAIVNTPVTPMLGDNLTFTATIAQIAGGPVPGGTITWTVTVNGVSKSCDSTTGAGTYIQSCTIRASVAGTYVAAAAYSGDNNYLPINQNSNPVTIAKYLPTVTVLNSGTPTAGGSVTFNAIVQGVANAESPTGTFTWSISGTGETSTCTPTTPSFSSANALVFSCTEALPSIGTYDATGTYSGDSNYLTNNATAPDVITITSSSPQYLPTTLGQITNLQITATQFSALVTGTLTWNPLSGANIYTVQVGASLSALLPVTCADDTQNTCTIANLISGDTYYFWVNGYQTNTSGTLIGQGIPATTSIALPAYTPPGIPAQVIPTSGGGLPASTVPFPLAAPALKGVGGDKTVTLSWPISTDSLRTGYLVDYSTDGQNFSKPIAVPANATTTTISGLTNGVSTVFRLTPVGASGNGVASVTSVTPGVAADAPSSLTAQSGDSQVDLSWVAPTNTGGLAINSYLIEESTDGTNWSVAASTDGSTTSVNLQGLKNFTSYTFRVSAITNFGKGQSATLSATATVLPSAPLSLHVVSTGSQTVTIGWALPTDASAGQITGFKVEQSVDGNTWTQVANASGTSLTATLTGLTNGTTYEIRVSPISGAGQGASSVILAAPGAVPGQVTGLTATPGDKKVVLTFTTPTNNGGYSIDYYYVEVAKSPNGPWTVANPNTGSSITSVTIPSLVDGTTYYFRVSAVNQVGQGQASAAVGATPQPAAPAPIVQSFVLGKTTATIAWIPAPGATSKQIQKYTIETSLDGKTWTAVKTIASSIKKFTVNRLKAPQLIRVRAVTAIGPGVPTLGIRIPGTVASSGLITSGAVSSTGKSKTTTTTTKKVTNSGTPGALKTQSTP